MKILPAVAFCVAVSHSCVAPSGKTEAEVNDVNTPLHLMQPHYETGYGIPAEAEVKQTMDRVLTYLEGQMENLYKSTEESGLAEIRADACRTGRRQAQARRVSSDVL